MEDYEIVDYFLARDESAIRLSREKYGARLFNLAENIVNDRSSAEECENDTYWAAWNAIPPHEPRTYLFAFLARITRHLALNLCRDRHAQKRDAVLLELSREMEACIPAPDDAPCRLEAEVLRKAINGFLEALPLRKRQIFLRRYWYMDSLAQICRRFGISESAAKSTLFRLRSALREYLLKEGYEL